MDLVILYDHANKYGDECLAACEKTHRDRISGIGSVMRVGLSAPDAVSVAVAEAISMGVSDDFILTTGTTFIVDDWDVSVLRQRRKFATRKGSSIDMMINTITYLVNSNLPTFDYQIDVPLLVNKKMAEQVLDVHGVHGCHFRSLYCNMYFDGGERMDDPFIDLWLHSMDPAGPVVSLGRTALHHPQCRKWVSRLLE